MKITGVTTHLLSANWAAIDEQWADTGSGYKTVALVRIETDAGITGLGEIIIGYFAPEAVPDPRRLLLPHLIGKDPLQTTPLWNRMYESRSGGAGPGPRCRSSPASTSRCGTSRARRSACRSIRCSAA